MTIKSTKQYCGLHNTVDKQVIREKMQEVFNESDKFTSLSEAFEKLRQKLGIPEE